MQVTATPARVAISMHKTELTHEYITQSKVFAVATIKQSVDLPFIGLFGFKSGRDIDKLEKVKYKIANIYKNNQTSIKRQHTIESFPNNKNL